MQLLGRGPVLRLAACAFVLAGVLASAVVCASAGPAGDDASMPSGVPADEAELERRWASFEYSGPDEGVRRVRAATSVALPIVAERLPVPGGAVRVSVEAPRDEPCPPRAMAASRDDGAAVVVFLDPGWSESELRRFVAHELGHVFHFPYLRPMDRPKGDAVLSEGIATWASGPLWLADLELASFADAVRASLEDGSYPGLEAPLLPAAAVSSRAACFADRELRYTVWAGFVEYLIARFGLEHVLEASARPREVLDGGLAGGASVPRVPAVPVPGMPRDPRPGRSERPVLLAPFDYEATFGSSLEELEADWLEALAGSDASAR